MKGMKSADEFQQAPAPGRYWSVVAAADATFAKSGASMIKLTPTIDDPRFPQFKDASCDDYIITDGGAKGGGMGKTKLRGLGIDVDSSDADVADEAICAQLLGRGCWVDYGNEQRMTRTGEDGPYNIPMTATDARTGQMVKLMKLTVKGYAVHNVGASQQAPAQQVTQPQIGQPPPQQLEGRGQYAPQAPQQYAQAPQQYAPQGFVPAPGFAPPSPIAGLQPAFPAQGQMQAAPPWAGQQQPNGAPSAPAPKKPKKLQIQEGSGEPQ
jgi:hypothetical protein